ncbi:LysR family transcriptional regulator [Actinoplanes sp. NPDC020271]|uniref:LysR family transcriptional regulator n=1 Tax=Actinoplanes sp. NPDC020271 TaxID=3363896 RepID=UPI0037A98F18
MSTLRQFEYLVTVIDTGSFTRAAELLHVSQPALSHQIRALERATGATLLERSPVRPTPMGRAMLPHARAALAAAETARLAARRAGALDEGELRLAAVYSVTLGLLPGVLRAWRQRHPRVRVRVFEHRHADELTAAMAAGQADLAIGPRPPASWPGRVFTVRREDFLLVKAHEPDAGATTMAAYAEVDWVLYAPGNGLADVVVQACAAAGFTPRAAVHIEQTAAVPLLAAAGLGVALVPAGAVPPGLDAELIRPDPPIVRDLVAYARDEPDPLAAAFVALLTSGR